MIPWRKAGVPETLFISPNHNIAGLGPASAPLPPPPNRQAIHARSKTLTLQLGRGGESSPGMGTGRNRPLLSSKYWTGRGTGGLQSPRLHGLSPREVNAFEQRKSIVESIPEEGNRDGGNEDEGKREGEELVFDMGESGLRGKRLSTENWEASDRDIAAPPQLVSGTRSSAKCFLTPDWPLPLLPGVGILPDTLHPSLATVQVSPPDSDTDRYYRSLNRPSISATGKTVPQGLNIPLQQQSVTAVANKLPPSPVDPYPRVSLLLPPPDLEDRSRLVSITPSLAAELELEESEGGSYCGENIKGPSTPEAKPRQASGRRAVDVPILSTFSTDTDTDFTEDELEDEKGQADYLPLQTVPGQLLNLVEIDGGDPAMGRKRSIRRKPVLGKSKLAQEGTKRNSYRGGSGTDSPSYTTRAQDRPRLLDMKRANYKGHAHPPVDEKSPGVYPQQLSGVEVYEASRSQPTNRTKQAKLLGFGGGTRELKSIDYMKGLERGNSVKTETEKRSSRNLASREWDGDKDREDIMGDSNGHRSEEEGLGENSIYVTGEFDVDVMDAPTEVPAKEQERVDSDTDVETGRRRRNLSLSGQSWLETTTGKRMTTPTANNTGDWREAVGLGNMKEEEAAPLVGYLQTLEKSTAVKKSTAVNITPRLPIYNPPEVINNTQMNSPMLSTLTIPPPPPGPKDLANVFQSHTKASLPPLPQYPHQVPHKPRKRYVTLTLNLYRSRNEPPRTTRILVPISPAARGYDDHKIFSKIKKEYIATAGGVWRTWCGLRGIKWVGINEVRTFSFYCSFPPKKSRT